MAVDVVGTSDFALARNSGWTRRSGLLWSWVVGPVLVLAVLGGFSEGDWAGATFEGLFGAGLILWAVSESVCSVRATSNGLELRRGPFRRSIPRSRVVDIAAVRGRFPGDLRYALRVTVSSGRPRSMRILRQLPSTSSHRALEEASSLLSATLGLRKTY